MQMCLKKWGRNVKRIHSISLFKKKPQNDALSKRTGHKVCLIM